jgi:hypothetical protein
MFRVVGASVGNIVQHILRIQSEALCDLHKTLRTESALGVDVKCLAFTTTHCQRQLRKNHKQQTEYQLTKSRIKMKALHVKTCLAGHTQRVTNLSLASSEFAKHFGDGTSLHTAAQQLVELLGTSRQIDDISSEIKR